jgi:hypothetical protein
MSFKIAPRNVAFACISISMIMFSCQKSADQFETAGLQAQKNEKSNGVASIKGTSFYALTTSNEILNYLSGNPLKEVSSVAVTGLQAGEKLLAIDFRPATGQLYAVSNQSRIYFINTVTGAAYTPSLTPFTPAINGTMVGFDFNPTVDRIRLVTNTGQNLRLNPETGMLAAIDGSLNPGAPVITAVAYSNSFAGTTTTTLYDIDVSTNKLYKQIPPNAGTLVEVGPLGVEAVGEAGFDISPDNSVAIAALFGRGDDGDGTEKSNGNKYRFYYIDLNTGKATNAGKTDREIIGVAIPSSTVAYAVTNLNQMLIMNPTSGSIISKAITGLPMGEMIAGIDMRPATGQLYALGMSSKIYAINMSNGAAAQIGSMAFTPMLSGSSFGFDFNPTVDRIRVVSNSGQNLRLHPTTGAVAAVDPNLNPGSPSVDAVAYTNSFGFPAASTMLFDVDVTTNMLYQQNPANAGVLVPVGSLGINVNAGNGFDIGGTSNKAWGIFSTGTQTALYSVNLMTGKATYELAVPYNIKGFAIGLGF